MRAFFLMCRRPPTCCVLTWQKKRGGSGLLLFLGGYQSDHGCSTHLHCCGCCCSVAKSFAPPWTAACQAFLSFIISQSLLKLMFTKLVMPSNHVILCCPLLLLPSIFLSIRVFPSESAVCIRWPRYWSFSFSFSPSNEYSGLISF